MEGKHARTILIAEDNTEFRATLRDFLEKLGYYVIEACDGKEALEIFEREDPPLVLLAADIPLLDGLEVSRTMRQLDRDEYSPVLMMTPDENHEYIKHAFEAGVADFIIKPIHWSLLRHKIEYMLRASKNSYAIQKNEEYLHNLFQSLPLGYESLDKAGNYVEVNPAWCKMTGFQREDVIGKACVDYLHEDSKESFLHHLGVMFDNGDKPTNIEFQFVCSNGAIIDVESNGHISKDSHGDSLHAHYLIDNITERKHIENVLIEMANTDGLTGACNRRAFLESAARDWKLSTRYQHPLNTLMIDIDHFKLINDSYGHAKGDEVLKDVANTCKLMMRETDTFGRLGGEEFAVIYPETDQQNALLGAERIRQAIEKLQFSYEGKGFTISVSIGVAGRQAGDESFELLLNRADEALYEAKQNGRNRVRLSL